MNCHDIQKKLAGAEPGRNDPAVRAHLESCADCRAAEARETGLDRLLAMARAERPDAHFETRLIARIRSEMADHKTAPLFWTPVRVWSAGLAAAAALLLFAWMPTLLNSHTELPRMAGANLNISTETHPTLAGGMPALAADSLFTAPNHSASPSLIPGLSLHEIPGAESTLVLASTNMPLRLSPDGIRYGGESMMVNFEKQN